MVRSQLRVLQTPPADRARVSLSLFGKSLASMLTEPIELPA
jgi:hypothetical protein